MSGPNLPSQIEEDHLTCHICLNIFKVPKALPCVHTFCEHCLREYVTTRGFEASGEFPCPLCRKTVQIPGDGLSGLPDNHMVKSLLDTVDKMKVRPTPKPRKSLQQTKETEAETMTKEMEAAASADPPPPYYSADEATLSAGKHELGSGSSYCETASQPPAYPTQPTAYPTQPPTYPTQPPFPHQPAPYPPSSYPTQPNPYPMPAPNAPYQPPPHNAPPPDFNQQPVAPYPVPPPGPPIYPTIPPSVEPGQDPCSHNLQLKFGKKGASVTDFHKPFGLAISDQCDFVITDLSGNRIFVFDYCGQPKKAFKCDCRIKDVAVDSNGEIVVVVNKPGAVIRRYNMTGRMVGEHGKFITHEETHGVALLGSGGAVVTGTMNHSVYTLTDQHKLAAKFGRKGTGDGYFLSPAFVATDSRGHIIVSDDQNHNIQIFSSQGKFKGRFGGMGSRPGQLLHPMGVAVDAEDNIIIADSGNHRVELFSSRGAYLRTIVANTNLLGEDVRPVNVAMTPRGSVAVLLNGNYFAEIRVYSPGGGVTSLPSSVKESTTWYLVN